MAVRLITHVFFEMITNANVEAEGKVFRSFMLRKRHVLASEKRWVGGTPAGQRPIFGSHWHEPSGYLSKSIGPSATYSNNNMLPCSGETKEKSWINIPTEHLWGKRQYASWRHIRNTWMTSAPSSCLFFIILISIHVQRNFLHISAVDFVLTVVD